MEAGACRHANPYTSDFPLPSVCVREREKERAKAPLPPPSLKRGLDGQHPPREAKR